MKGILLTLIIALLAACGLVDDHAGATTTGNTGKIAGVVVFEVPLAKTVALDPDSMAVFADVYLYYSHDRVNALDSVRTDASGEFEFDSLKAGSYYVRAILPTGEQTNSGDLTLAADEIKQLTLVLGQESSQYTSLVQIGQGDKEFEVAFRDFQPSHPDFEHFDTRWEEISASPLEGVSPPVSTGPQCYGKHNPTIDANYFACEDGYPCLERPQEYWGEYKINNGPVLRTHRHKAVLLAGMPAGTMPPRCPNAGLCYNWEDPVFANRGMVLPTLKRVDPYDPRTWVPLRNPEAVMSCHSDHLEEWFEDRPDVNRTVRASLALKAADADKWKYGFDSKDLAKGIYYPLDTFDGSSLYQNYGKQTLKLWCPPYGPLNGNFDAWKQFGGAGESGPSGSNERVACEELLATGGSRSNTAARSLAQTNEWATANLHNYHFTSAIYSKFTYKPGYPLQFLSDGDLWVFIDGVLALDLGGTGLPKDGRIDLDAMAKQYGWETPSMHDIHIFQANRHTDGSYFKFETLLGYPIAKSSL